MCKICFTGYRPFKLPFAMSENDSRYKLFVQKSRQLIKTQIELGCSYFISGMAQGADMLFAEIVLELKKTYPHLKLECALPFLGQTFRWPGETKARYEDILSRCDKVIAVYDGKKGGTKFTIDYARKRGKQVIVIDPLGEIHFQESMY